MVVGAGAKILGAITIGAGSRIGANAVVVKSVPANSVVVGVPGPGGGAQPAAARAAPDLNHDQLPDTIGASLVAVMARLDALEAQMRGHVDEEHPVLELAIANGNGNGNGREPAPMPHAPDHGVWRGQDFMI